MSSVSGTGVAVGNEGGTSVGVGVGVGRVASRHCPLPGGQGAAGTVVVAESGISSHDDIRRLQDAGVDAVLVGEALMAADDTSAAISELMTGGP